MSRPQSPEPALNVQGASSIGPGDEDAADGTQHSHRMLSFSDALLSIIATVMILPVTHTDISPEQEFDKSIQKLLATRIAVYLMTFLIVTVAWAAHTRTTFIDGVTYPVSLPLFRLFQVVGKIDDTLALLNLACMMTITFLPFTFSLMVTFPDVPLGIFLFCMCVIAIGAVQALIVGYAFHFPHLLNPQIQRSAHQALYKRHILRIILHGPALCFAAAGFSLFFYPALVTCLSDVELEELPHVLDTRFFSDRRFAHAPSLLVTLPDAQQSYLLMATVIFLPYVSKAASWCRGRLVGPREPPAHSLEFFTFDLHGPLSKERVEAFSDGVYAIVATLLILDICEDNVPDPKDVREKFSGSLVAALSESGPHFLAYFGSFATVGLLWFAHHSLFLHVRKATQPMGLLNTLSLAFVGGLPLAYQQTSAFAQQPHDELERVRVSCAIIFFASIFQFAIWTTALLQEGETLQPSARFGGQEHAFMFAKLALYPCASLLAFASTCILTRFSTAIFHLMQIAVPFAFLLLRLLVRLALAILRALPHLALRPAPTRPAPGGPRDDTCSLLLPAPC
ncbi:endosomal/lysosomal proton channel TMEM175 isoform X3 [Camelus dromedarius]|uniref:endosomal/lysosomal proton channel TMEM175 isoform X3 n=1 Tax=Camelus dromedarius TaxID=9838 RepID=UPI001262E286|nr:endosomal/lysosomal potassium channel TMEM175 isoform X1 [Camelus dromedarius]XP_031295332.1 endosomal/lysosomal potassium channel TMEM175 isoform X1 [Camelus dromedarius]